MSDTKTADLTSQVDGANNNFTVPESFIPSTLAVEVNGIRLRPSEYTETSTTTFSINVSSGYPTPLMAVETLLVQYEVTGTGAISGLVVSGIDPASSC